MLFNVFFNTVVFINTLALLIIVHECGHFLVARFFKVKIERFSIGFGPVLWSRKDSSGTEYTISAILLGGYVKLNDTLIKEINNYPDQNNSFDFKSIWKRSLIIISGPVFNFVFAILLYIIVFIIGVSHYTPMINYILPNSIIEKSEIPIGSKIKSVNNVQVNNWESVRLQILSNINKEKIIFFTESIDNGNTVSKINVVYLPVNWFNKSDLISEDPIITLGMFPNFLYITSVISSKKLYFFDQQNSLKIGDKILLINNQPIYNLESFIQIIKSNLHKKFSMVLERNQHLLHLDCTLIENCLIDYNKIQKNIDLFINTVVVGSALHSEIHRYQLCTAISKSFNKVWDYMYLITYTLFQLMNGNLKVINLHGPIAIAKIAGQTVHYGIIYYLMFLAVLSVNLGIINLLPFPILDGGQLLFLLIEKIRGRPILIKTQNFIYIISIIVLIIIMFATLYNDITL